MKNLIITITIVVGTILSSYGQIKENDIINVLGYNIKLIKNMEFTGEVTSIKTVIVDTNEKPYHMSKDEAVAYVSGINSKLTQKLEKKLMPPIENTFYYGYGNGVHIKVEVIPINDKYIIYTSYY